MSEEPRPEWLPPRAPGAQPPRTWHTVAEPVPGTPEAPEGEAPGAFSPPGTTAPAGASSSFGAPATSGAPSSPGAPAAPGAPSSSPPARDPRDWWRADRVAGGSAPVPAPVPAPFPVAGAAGNGQALASLVLGIAGLVLFFVSGFGLVFILNLPCSIMAWVLGVQGRRKVDRGETAGRRGMAQAGMLLGIVGTVIGGLAIIAWALGFLLSHDLRHQFQHEWEKRQNA